MVLRVLQEHIQRLKGLQFLNHFKRLMKWQGRQKSIKNRLYEEKKNKNNKNILN